MFCINFPRVNDVSKKDLSVAPGDCYIGQTTRRAISINARSEEQILASTAGESRLITIPEKGLIQFCVVMPWPPLRPASARHDARPRTRSIRPDI